MCVGGVLRELPGLLQGHPGTEQASEPGVNSFGLPVLHHFYLHTQYNGFQALGLLLFVFKYQTPVYPLMLRIENHHIVSSFE